MSAVAFAYALLLGNIESRAELLLLLPQDRQAEVQIVLDQCEKLSQDEIRKQLRQLRRGEVLTQTEDARGRTRLPLEHVSPGLRAWLIRPF